MTKESKTSLNPAPGQKLAGCYLLEHPLDAGGGHVIWIAQDEVLGKEVSLHFLPDSVTRDAAAIEELRLEIKRNRPLIHPGVLRVYDLVEGPDWTAIAMESFDGRCLAALLEEEGRFEVDDVQQWLDEICVTLEEAHRIKLTHRDLAPENIFINASGHAVLANFGTSRIVQSSLEKSSPDQVAPSHWSSLSPQLLDGDTPAPTDDVYGIGALLFQLLSGHPVFESGSFADQIRHSTPRRLSDVRDEATDPGAAIPEGWENVIAACLNKKYDERPQHPAEVVSSIEAYIPAPGAPASEGPAVSEEAETVIESEPMKLEVLPAPADAETKQEEVEPAAIEVPAAVEMPASIEEPAALEAPAAVEEPKPATKPEEPELVEPEPSESETVEAHEPAAISLPAQIETIATEPAHGEKVAEPKTSPPALGPKPVHLYDTDEDAFSSILPRRFRFPAAVAAAVALVLFLINGAFKETKEKPAPTRPLSTIDSTERSELTSVKNSVPEPPAPEAPSPATARPNTTAEAAPASPAPQASADQQEILLAAGPGQKKAVTPIAVIPAAPDTPGASGPVEKVLPEKIAALERLKADLANSEKTQQARVKEQTAAATALAETQKAIDDKMKAVSAAKKSASDLLAARKKIEDEQKTAETAAQAAQQLAAEKARASEEAKKALADFEAKNRDKLAGQEKAEAEIQALQRTLAERQKAAEDVAKAAAAAETARQQQLATLKQTEQEIEQLKSTAAKASAESAQRKQAVDAERHKLDDEIAAMRALFEQKMKDIESRKRELEGAPAAAPAASAPAPSASAAPVPAAPQPKPSAPAAPAPALPLMARAGTPSPTITTPAPAPAPAPVAPAAGGATNSLGMRFAPVGDVQFCVWQTRVKDFEAFAKSVNLKSTAWRGPGFRQGPDHPVVNVTWNEAIAFCKWLTDKEHKEGALPANQFYRLPYDLEWSKAVGLPDETGRTPEARDMGVPDVYPWGTDWPPPKGAGNYTGEETGSDVAIKGYDDGFAWTSPVGSFPPNKLGLYDMGGNVWQWCMDAWNNESKAKVLRGASWYNGALKLSLLSSCRVHAAPDSSTDNYGFRIVRATETASIKPAKK